MICQFRISVLREGIFKSNLNFKCPCKVTNLLKHFVFMKAFLDILILSNTAVAMSSKGSLGMHDLYTEMISRAASVHCCL